jgi:hypothetical protein
MSGAPTVRRPDFVDLLNTEPQFAGVVGATTAYRHVQDIRVDAVSRLFAL